MALRLRKATEIGRHLMCKFRNDAGVLDYISVSDTDFSHDLTADTDTSRAYRLRGGADLRPRSNAKFVGASYNGKFDTRDGFLQPGDYMHMPDGELWIKLEDPDPARKVIVVLEPGDFIGNPDLPATLNAALTVSDDYGDTHLISIVAGVLA